MNTVGISALFHDSAACILQEGILKAASQEERFSRIKHDASMPRLAFLSCLDQTGLSICDIDCLAYYEDPNKKLERQVWMTLPILSEKLCERLWHKAKQPVKGIRECLGYEGPIEFVSHHEAHAASAFYYSGFDEAAILTVDGVGEWTTTSYAQGTRDDIELLEEVHFPNSLGLLYSTLTSYLGFAVNDGEYKVMGLAPYGKPVWVNAIRQLLDLECDGQFHLNSTYFDFSSEKRMYTDALPELFGRPPRESESEITQFHKDVSHSLQTVLEEVLVAKVEFLHRRTGLDNLCMAGGVALNCVAARKILRDGPFRRLFVQPAASDAGCAIGAAAIAHRRFCGKRPQYEQMSHTCLGPDFRSDDIATLLSSCGLEVTDYRGNEAGLLEAAAGRLSQGQVIGWFHGRMEFGPRALGARSILADPRDSSMRNRINRITKKRESFRPFAPAALEVSASQHFELDHPSPFMTETCRVISSVHLPAITHVDGSARVQTVNESTHPRFAKLIERFGQHTGCPILLNTSFNMRGEPIVCSPVDALMCFARSDLDVLILEDFFIDRSSLNATWEEQLRGLPRADTPVVSDSVYTLL